MHTIFVRLIIFFLGIQLTRSQSTTNFSCQVRPSQIDTGDRLRSLRVHLANKNLYAYVIFSADEHDSEYVQESDERRAWMTGFLGSAGTAVVTRDAAALWTDGRYWTQAEDELDCRNWQLMRQGQSGVPSLSGWLSSQVNSTPPYDRVGAAAQFASSSWWSSMSATLEPKNVSLVEVRELVDEIWMPPNRPVAPANPVNTHEQRFTGEPWSARVSTIARLVQAKKADVYIVTVLDEIAWLFCLRGSDIPYNPFFKAYAIVHANGTAHLWMNASQLTSAAGESLKTVNIRPYDSFFSDLLAIAEKSDMSKIWFSASASQAVYNRVPSEKRLIAASPVELTKAIKNPTEQQGTRDCGIRDSVARIRHLTWLQDQLNRDVYINETRSAEELERFQGEEEHYRSLSFDTISAFGPNAAIIHYSPHAKTAAQITKNGLYLLDAGAQYLDCTTDVTRTHVFGTATEAQKKAYTLVLQGSTDLADAVFPYGTYGRSIDILARQSLYKNFMDYNHGTGHGIGHYLSVHEGPSFISMGYSSNDIPLTDGLVFSDEPGFYLPNQFGIRLETDILVKNYTLPNNYGGSTAQFLRFEMLTWVPFEHNLIVCSMLTKAQKDWLNWYHAEVRRKLEATGRLNSNELAYLREHTEEIKC